MIPKGCTSKYPGLWKFGSVDVTNFFPSSGGWQSVYRFVTAPKWGCKHDTILCNCKHTANCGCPRSLEGPRVTQIAYESMNQQFK